MQNQNYQQLSLNFHLIARTGGSGGGSLNLRQRIKVPQLTGPVALRPTKVMLFFLLLGTLFVHGYAFATTDFPINRVNLQTDTALWTGIFGTLTYQKPTDISVGYKATASGGLLGLDHCTERGDVYGLALGISNSNLQESIHNGFVSRIMGWHAILYGTKILGTDSYFLEWLLTGVANKNQGTRYSVSGGSTVGVNSSYRTSQAGIRLNLAQSTSNDIWGLTFIETIRYAAFYQPTYNVLNSTAISQANPKKYNDIFTLGGGVRISAATEEPWLTGAREIRFMGTYDLVTSTQVTVANFLNSISDFNVASAMGRWAFQVGASYTFTFCEHVQLQFSYDFELRTKYTDNSGEAKLRFLF